MKFRSSRQSLFVVLLAVIFLFEHASFPLPLNDARVPQIYQTLAVQPGDFAVLELPTGWRNGARVLGKSDKLIMMQQWYQAVHGKRRLGGNTSRNPAYKFQYFTEAPLIGDLIGLMNADRDYMTATVKANLNQLIAQDRPIAGQVLDFLGVRYVTLDLQRSPPALVRFVEEALPLEKIDEWHGLDWTGAPDVIRLYQVQPQPVLSTWEVNLADPVGKLYLAEGWSALAAADNSVRFATRAQADLLLNLPRAGGRLALELFGPAEQVEVTLNGRLLTTANLKSEPNGQWVTADVPPGMMDGVIERLTLQFKGPLTPVTTLLKPPTASGWPIGKTGTSLPSTTSLVAYSAGNDVGDIAHLFVNGRDMALSGSDPAYNLVALDARGNVVDHTMFDTHSSTQAATDMAAWLERWPAGMVIAGAVADEASDKLSEVAVKALTRVGVTGNLRGKLRWSHAFIGVVGAPPGSALEQMTLLQPAAVFAGAPVDAAQVSGGVGRIRFTKK